jgi:hypothetical protein
VISYIEPPLRRLANIVPNSSTGVENKSCPQMVTGTVPHGTISCAKSRKCDAGFSGHRKEKAATGSIAANLECGAAAGFPHEHLAWGALTAFLQSEPNTLASTGGWFQLPA